MTRTRTPALADDAAARRGCEDPDRPDARDVGDAIEQGEVGVQFQPIVDLATRRFTGVEALARWRHPTLGTIMPETFVPVAEDGGLAWALTRRVLEAALWEIGRWPRGLRGLDISVNLSPVMLDNDRLPDHILDLLRGHRVSPGRVVLEVTENRAIPDPDRSTAILGRLRHAGIRLVLDDFGTGFASLDQLYRQPYHGLKIDKDHLQLGARGGADAERIRETVRIGREAGLQITAEGIETAEVYQWVTSLGCDLGQGYLIGSPLDGSSIARWHHRWSWRQNQALDPGTVPVVTI